MSLTAVLRSFLPCFLPLTSTVSPESKSSARLTVAPGRRRSGSPTLSIRSCRVSLIRSPLLDRRVRTGAPRTSVREHVPFRLAPHGSTHRDLASGPRSRGSTSASRSGTHRTTIRRLSHPYPQCSLNLPSRTRPSIHHRVCVGPHVAFRRLPGSGPHSASWRWRSAPTLPSEPYYERPVLTEPLAQASARTTATMCCAPALAGPRRLSKRQGAPRSLSQSRASSGHELGALGRALCRRRSRPSDSAQIVKAVVRGDAHFPRRA